MKENSKLSNKWRAWMNMSLFFCMQDFRKISPIVVKNTSDHQVLMFLKNFDTRLRLFEDEIFQTCKFALESKNLTISLKGFDSKHDYFVTFEQFVIDCKILNVIDEFIKFVIKDTRCIDNVIVFDVFFFKSSKIQFLFFDNECKNLLVKIIRIKKSRMLLCCWNEKCINHWMKQFQSLSVDWLFLKFEKIIENQNAIIVRSFHSIKVVCYEKCNVNYRVFLIYRFVFAFVELFQSIQMFNWIKTISEKNFDDVKYDAR